MGLTVKILAIETSCDETAVSLVEISGNLEKPDIKVLGDSLISQAEIHEKYGGVYPNLAKREHEKNLPILLEKTLKEAGESANWRTENPKIDYIAVTEGPGLEPALWTGIGFALELGRLWQKPVIPVNHMEGHIFSILFNIQEAGPLKLPALALLVSGGHTELVLVKDFGDYVVLGETKDDAAGEAFDKVARMLGLPYPGGPQISRLAELSREKKRSISVEFPKPMIHSKDLNFSFSGLKTAVLYKLRRENRLEEGFKEDVARAFEDAVVAVLVEKTDRALLELGREVKTLIVAGGVSANIHLIRELMALVNKFYHLSLKLPTKYLSTDNAVMIAIAAFIRINTDPQIIKNQVPIRARGRLPIFSATSR